MQSNRASRLGLQLVLAGPLAVSLLFFVRFGSHSWHPTDYEMMVGFAWRVWNGQVPYRDFLYVRTPLSLYVHCFWFALPDTVEVRLSRLGYYLQFATAAALPALAALRTGVVAFSWRLPLLCVLFCVVAFHSFPIMPWYTLDGVWCSSLGMAAALMSIAAEARPRAVLAWRVAASVCFFAAAMCKQNFATLPVAFALVAAFELRRGLRRDPGRDGRATIALFAASVLPMLALGLAFALWLWATDAWPGFMAQVVGSSTDRKLSEGGQLLAGGTPSAKTGAYAAYLSLDLLPALLSGCMAGALAGYAPGAIRALRLPQIAGTFALLYVASAVLALAPDRTAPLGHQLWVLLLGLLIGRSGWLLATRGRHAAAPQRARLLLHGGVLLTAWSAGVSWGYVTPILGLAAAGVVVHDALAEEGWWPLDLLPVALTTALVVAAIHQANALAPYRDRPVAEQTADLGALFPKLTGIRTGEQTFLRYQEAARLVRKLALPTRRPFFVLHEYPGLNYLFDTQNPVSIDWFWESDYVGSEARILREMRARRPIVLMMRERITDFPPGPRRSAPPTCAERPIFYRTRMATPFALEVLRRGTLLRGGSYFCAFALD